jgi:hypothetical protein
MAIYADSQSKKEARKRWRQSEKGKAWDKAYAQRDYVKAKKHDYYVNNKMKWYKENDLLNTQNTIGFKNGA